MKKNFKKVNLFDRRKIEDQELNAKVDETFYAMALVLTPEKLFHYSNALGRRKMETGIQIVMALYDFIHRKSTIYDVPMMENTSDQQLYMRLLGDFLVCADDYDGGFIMGLLYKLNYKEGSPEQNAIDRFVVHLCARMEALPTKFTK